MGTNIYDSAKDIRGIPSNAERLLCDCEEPALLKYAWLENEAGVWCFLTSPFADPVDARRRWKNEHKALVELEEEGWQIIHAYPRDPEMKPDSSIDGYGLRRTIH